MPPTRKMSPTCGCHQQEKMILFLSINNNLCWKWQACSIFSTDFGVDLAQLGVNGFISPYPLLHGSNFNWVTCIWGSELAVQIQEVQHNVRLLRRGIQPLGQMLKPISPHWLSSRIRLESPGISILPQVRTAAILEFFKLTLQSQNTMMREGETLLLILGSPLDHTWVSSDQLFYWHDERKMWARWENQGNIWFVLLLLKSILSYHPVHIPEGPKQLAIFTSNPRNM